MATIRPSIYIGLGGTGILAISKAKKMYEDAYGKGNIPEQIAFIAIDFDFTMENNSSLETDMSEDFLDLGNMSNPKQLYDVRSEQGDYKWIFPSNTRFIGTRVVDGASQVRTYGRFLTEMIKDSILKRIKTSYNQVKSIQNKLSEEEKKQPIDIHISLSLAGGTGCGSFLNIADLIRNEYGNNVKIIGYGVLHSVFRTMDTSTNKSPRVVANAYSAILDLDYLMSASNDNPIKLSLNGVNKTTTQPIFDEFYIIDNETENQKIVDNIQKLCEVLGTCLFVAGSTMGSKINSGSSNTGWKNGNFNISPKLGWVQSLGACQVVYKGDLLAEIYGLKTAKEIIRKLLGSKADIENDVVTWTEEIGIREDGDNNRLIDGIYATEKIEKAKEPVLDINDSLTIIKSAVNKYLNTYPEYPTEKALEDKVTGLIKKLRDKINKLLNAENGIGNTIGFLNTLEQQLNLFKNEMNSEKSVFEKKYTDAKAVLDNQNFKGYEDFLNKWFVTARKKEENLEDLIARPAQRILKDRLESERRDSAYKIFTKILAEVAELKKKIEDLSIKIKNLKADYLNELNRKQSSSQSSLVFEIDLSLNERKNIGFGDSEVLIVDFINSLGKSLYDVDLNEELDQSIKSFVNTLNTVNEYRNKLIADVIEKLDEKGYQYLKTEIAEKSSRLLPLEDRGQMSRTRNNALATSMLVQNYLVSYFQKIDGSGKPVMLRFEKDKAFLKDNNIDKEFLPSDFDSMKQKIIFYRSDAAIIPYCISAFDELTVEKEYNSLIVDALQENSTSFNPHFDKELFLEMKSRDFKLKPELHNEAIIYWICGSLFGWQTIKESRYIMQKDNNGKPEKIERKEDVELTKYIRVIKGKYYFWDEEGESKGMDGKWVSINSAVQRDQAFTFFKTGILPQIKQTLQAKIKNDIAKKGKAYYETLIDGIIIAGKFDYIDTLVCSDKNSLTYYNQAKGEDKQLDEEWKFIEKQLKNALSNL